MRGLYAVTPDSNDTQALIAHVRAALAGGARFVQYRNKTASRGLRLEQASALQSLCSEWSGTLIINDHVDLAIAVGAEGVHLGAKDGLTGDAREMLGPGKLVGISCYDRLDLAVAAQAAGADYIAFGSFFPSRVKPGAVHAPMSLLFEVKREVSIPVVAIGGITVENAPELIAAGADALAVITALFGAPDIQSAARAFSGLFEPSA